MRLARSGQEGFTFIGVLLLVAIAGLALVATGELWSTAAKRDREAQLLFVGDEFRRAIGSYYESSPGAKRFPEQLDDLLEDRRFPVVRRHLRKIYRDPMTNSQEWGLVQDGGRITGVYSVSSEAPLKTANFAGEDEAFKGSGAYADWRFVYRPAVAAPTPAGQGTVGAAKSAGAPPAKAP